MTIRKHNLDGRWFVTISSRGFVTVHAEFADEYEAADFFNKSCGLPPLDD